MKSPKISVIMCVYNGAKYIKKAIKSVLSQNYNNFELVVVNDGSTDNTEEIVNSFCKTDNRIRIVNKENGGLSSARNFGMNEVKGDLIMFCDADDEYLEGAFSSMIDMFDYERTDLLICSINNIFIRKKEEILPNLLITKEDAKNNFNEYNSYFYFTVAKFYKTEIIRNNNLTFRLDVHFTEDYEFNLKYINCTENPIKISDKIVYNYYTRRSSTNPKTDSIKYHIDVILNFFGGKENTPKDICSSFVSHYYMLTLKRYASWYGNTEKCEKLLNKALLETVEYFDEEILKSVFDENEVEYIKNCDAVSLLKSYFKKHPEVTIDRKKFIKTKKLAQILDKAGIVL